MGKQKPLKIFLKSTKKATEKAIQNLKGNNYLQTDDLETVNYNSNIEPDDLSTVNCNSNVGINDVSDAETTNYNIPNKNSKAQEQAKWIIKKIKEPKKEAVALKNR